MIVVQFIYKNINFVTLLDNRRWSQWICVIFILKQGQISGYFILISLHDKNWHNHMAVKMSMMTILELTVNSSIFTFTQIDLLD